MDLRFGDVTVGCATAEYLAEAGMGEACVGLGLPEGVGWLQIGEVTQVAHELTTSAGACIDDAVFVTLAVADLDGSGFEVDVCEVEAAEFGATDAGVEQK